MTEVRDKYGDYQEKTRTAVSCRFRDIDTLRRESHAEIRDADAMIWFAPDEDVNNSDIFWFENVYYQVERITRAKKLGSSIVEFIKCDMKIVNIGVS